MLEEWFKNPVIAWAGIVVGVALLVVCAPAAWTVLTDDVAGSRGWDNAWPIGGSVIGLVLLGLAAQGLWLNRE